MYSYGGYQGTPTGKWIGTVAKLVWSPLVAGSMQGYIPLMRTKPATPTAAHSHRRSRASCTGLASMMVFAMAPSSHSSVTALGWLGAINDSYGRTARPLVS